jgi:hypothetical protein
VGSILALLHKKWKALRRRKNIWAEILLLQHDLKRQQFDLAQLRSMLQVGLDVNFRSPSWAIICIQGRSDYIKLVTLPDRDIQRIRQFLHQFDRENVAIDLPYGMHKDLFF